MLTSQMLTNLGFRLNDPNSVRYIESERYAALNDAQDHLTQTLPLYLITELEDTKEGISSSLGSNSRYSRITKTDITPNILRFVFGQFRSSTSSAVYPARIISSVDEGSVENNLLTGHEKSPAVIERTTSVQFYPALPSGHVIDITYIGLQTRIAIGVETELVVTLHPLLVELAELILKGLSHEMDNVIKRFLGI